MIRANKLQGSSSIWNRAGEEVEIKIHDENIPASRTQASSLRSKIQQFTHNSVLHYPHSSSTMLRRSQREKPLVGARENTNPPQDHLDGPVDATTDNSQNELGSSRLKTTSKFIPMKRPNSASQGSRLPSAKISKSSSKNSSAPIENKLKDSLRPGLKLIMVGVNPGETTARTGEAYAHKSNRYWPTMFKSGVTPIKHLPRDTHMLMDLYGIGHTNIVSRATKTEAGIQDHEWPEGAAILDEKIALYKPEGVAIVGKGIWKKWVEYKTGRRFNEKKDQFEYGWQAEDMQIGRRIAEDGTVIWPGAKTIVVATTSGLAAQFAANNGEMRLKLWKPLGDWYRPLREEWERERNNSASAVDEEQ